MITEAELQELLGRQGPAEVILIWAVVVKQTASPDDGITRDADLAYYESENDAIIGAATVGPAGVPGKTESRLAIRWTKGNLMFLLDRKMPTVTLVNGEALRAAAREAVLAGLTKAQRIALGIVE